MSIYVPQLQCYWTLKLSTWIIYQWHWLCHNFKYDVYPQMMDRALPRWRSMEVYKHLFNVYFITNLIKMRALILIQNDYLNIRRTRSIFEYLQPQLRHTYACRTQRKIYETLRSYLTDWLNLLIQWYWDDSDYTHSHETTVCYPETLVLTLEMLIAKVKHLCKCKDST